MASWSVSRDSAQMWLKRISSSVTVVTVLAGRNASEFSSCGRRPPLKPSVRALLLQNDGSVLIESDKRKARDLHWPTIAFAFLQHHRLRK
jgi:hypothetical protein